MSWIRMLNVAHWALSIPCLVDYGDSTEYSTNSWVFELEVWCFRLIYNLTISLLKRN